VRPNEEAALEVSIVERKWVDHTYIGDLTIIYNDNECLCFQGVELDVLAREPKNDDK
jgi:hypothetical protein